MTRMEQPSLGGNGKKKGYIRIMKDLWDAKGYGDLGLLSQNLRDQAARLEKTLQESTRDLACDAKTEGAANSRVCWRKPVQGCTNRCKFESYYNCPLKK